jgi:hypothetical protein
MPTATHCSNASGAAANAVMINWRTAKEAQSRVGAATRLTLATKAVAAAPQSALANYALAAELFRIGDNPAGIAAFELAMRHAEPTTSGLSAYAKALLARGRAEDALAAVRDGGDELLTRRSAALRALGRRAAALETALVALDRWPSDVEPAMEAYRALLAMRDWRALVRFHDDRVRLGAVSTPVLLARIAGLVGLGRTQEALSLLSADDFVRVSTIVAPAPFDTIADFNAGLEAEVAAPGTSRVTGAARLKMTGGVQVEDLGVARGPAIAGLIDVFARAVEDYVASRRGLADEVVRRLTPVAARISPWAVILGAEDSQDHHFHPDAAIAGVYYVAAPDDLIDDDAQDGCLIIPTGLFGVTPAKSLSISPAPGRLVLFPGYFPHRTTPTRRPARRVSIAFNVVAERAAGD